MINLDNMIIGLSWSKWIWKVELMMIFSPFYNLRNAWPPFLDSTAHSNNRYPCFHKPVNKYYENISSIQVEKCLLGWNISLNSFFTFSSWTEHFLQEKHFLWNSFPSTISFMSGQWQCHGDSKVRSVVFKLTTTFGFVPIGCDNHNGVVTIMSYFPGAKRRGNSNYNSVGDGRMLSSLVGTAGAGLCFFFRNSSLCLAFLLIVDGLFFFQALSSVTEWGAISHVSREKEKLEPVVREKENANPWLARSLQKSKHLLAKEESSPLTAAAILESYFWSMKLIVGTSWMDMFPLQRFHTYMIRIKTIAARSSCCNAATVQSC